MTGNTESILHTKAGQTFLTHGPQRVLKLGGRARAGADARSVMKDIEIAWILNKNMLLF